MLTKKFWAGIAISCTMTSAWAQAIVTESTSNSTTRSTTETTVNSPPPSAIAPSINSMNNDLCAVGVSGAAQTQILGIAIGSTFRDKNCERLKLAKNLYDMGMKVAAVATLCQDESVFVAMLNAGTPCPINGKIGTEARKEWDQRDLAQVEGADKIGDTGFYAAPINIREQPAADAAASAACRGYTGTDPIVLNRLECR
jgi:hypothetical protein